MKKRVKEQKKRTPVSEPTKSEVVFLSNPIGRPPTAIYLIDPPYLSTDTKTYTNMDYWRLGDYLDILKMLEGNAYFYFTSEKSQIIELVIWLSENGFKKNPFAGATTKVLQTTLSHTSKYNDIMMLKN